MNTLAAEYERALALWRESRGCVHLMGAGGVGVAGLARLLAARGWKTSGCDTSVNRLTQWLTERGVVVVRGHDPVHITADLDWLIRTAAVPADHPEVCAAGDRGVPVTLRGVALAALARGSGCIAVGGTHGKTTTTAMIARMARTVNAAAGCAIGAEVPDFDGVASPAGPEAPFVVEADESDGTLALYEPEIGVITNVDYDHMEHFENEQAFHEVFRSFARRVRRALIVGADDAVTRAVVDENIKVWPCGLAADAKVRGENVRLRPQGSTFDVRLDGHRLGNVSIPAPGLHNVRNALCALGVALALGWPFQAVRAALVDFRPARRRLEPVWDGDGIRVFSDYAHHPTEIRALLESVADFGHRRLLALFQPHRYTRTRALADRFPAAFDGVERLWLMPVYAASELPIEGGTTDDLLRHFDRFGRVRPGLITPMDEAWETLWRELRPGDLLLIIGAGDIEQLAERFRAAAGDKFMSSRILRAPHGRCDGPCP